MPAVQYGVSAYKRTQGSLPELKLINMFVESAKTSSNQVALQSRPGMAEDFSVGSGPIDAIFSKAGTFGGDIFSLSGSDLYREASFAGTVSGPGAGSIAGGYGEVCVTTGSELYSYNGTDLANAGFTGNATNDVTAVAFINSTFVAIEANSARIYWSDVLDGRTWDPLHFVTAERQPDNLLDLAPLGNNLWLFGAQSVEVHTDTGDQTARFEPLETLGYEKGIKVTGALCKADNAIFFTDSDNVVNRIGEAPVRISDHSIEERVGASASCRMFSYRLDGHEFVCVRLDDETLQYDCATQEWSELQTAQGNFIGACACTVDGEARFGHASTGQILKFSGWADLSDALERRFTFAQELESPVTLSSVKLWCNAGHTTVLTGQGSDPQVELRLSADAGNTFEDWEADDLGAEGEYSQVPEWRALGLFAFPGVLGEVRCTEPCDFRVSNVKINDPVGGR